MSATPPAINSSPPPVSNPSSGSSSPRPPHTCPPPPSRSPAKWLDDLNRLAVQSTLRKPKDVSCTFVQDVSNNHNLIINVGLLERTMGDCKDSIVENWSCDTCTDANRPEKIINIDTGSHGNAHANRLSLLFFGHVIIVAVRGSHDISNWMDDFSIGLSALPDWMTQPCTGTFECADGWLSIWNTMQDKLIKQLADAGVYPNETCYSLLFTGYSLGAAVTTIAAWAMYAKGYNIIGNLNFESPMPFTRQAAFCYHEKLGARTLRITNANDPVPHCPGHIDMGDFVHVGWELYMRQGEFFLCSFDDVTVCRDTFNKSSPPSSSHKCLCSSRDRTAWDPTQHCNTQAGLTFDFCQCNNDSLKAFLLVILKWFLIFAIVFAIGYLILHE